MGNKKTEAQRHKGTKFALPLVSGLALCFLIGSAGDVSAKESTQWLKVVRGGHHGDYTSVVFEFREKFSFSQPVVKEREVAILFKDTGTAVAPFRRYKSFDSWLRLTKRGRNLEATIGIPKDFPSVDHFSLSDPERLVVRFSKAKKAPAALEAAAPPPKVSATPSKAPPPAAAIAKAEPSEEAGKGSKEGDGGGQKAPLPPVTAVPKAQPAQEAGVSKPPSPLADAGPTEAPPSPVTAGPAAKPAQDGIAWTPSSPGGTITWTPVDPETGTAKAPRPPEKGEPGPTPPAVAAPKEAAKKTAPAPALPKEAAQKAGPVALVPKEAHPDRDTVSPKEAAPPEVKPLLSPGVPAKRTYNYRDIDIRQALSALAQDQDINIIMSPDVAGRITIYLTQVTLEEAIGSMAMAAGLAYTKQDGSYYVYRPKQAIDPYSERLHIRIFRMKFAPIEKIQDLLSSISGVRTVRIHEASKTIMVEDTLENIAKVEKVLASWDVAPRQVLIEARIMQVSLTDDMSMGVDWQKVFGDLTFGTMGLAPAAAVTTGFVAGTAGLTAKLTTGLGTRNQFIAAIEALQKKTNVNTLSTPRILAIHGKPARVQVGGRQGYKTTTLSPTGAAENISFLDTGTILEITPFIDDEGNVLLEVRPSINSVTIDTTGTPNQKTTTVSTSLMAKTGQTVFIGGLIEDTQTGTRDTIPCLGNIPGLGLLFGRMGDVINKQELIVLITPQIQAPEALSVTDIEKMRILEEKVKKTPLPLPQRLLEQTK